jgi:DNA-binding transcriptional MerR regulator
MSDVHGRARGEQGELFPASALGEPHRDGDGYRGPTACQIVGITYRQLDYWARTGLVVPTVRSASGSGSQRLYSFTDVLVLKVVKRLLDAGVSLQNIRLAVEHLRAHGVRDLAEITLLSDGITIYECRSPDEIVDLLRGGQGVFGIALDGAMREITGTIRAFPTERESQTATLTGLPSRHDGAMSIRAAG